MYSSFNPWIDSSRDRFINQLIELILGSRLLRSMFKEIRVSILPTRRCYVFAKLTRAICGKSQIQYSRWKNLPGTMVDTEAVFLLNAQTVMHIFWARVFLPRYANTIHPKETPRYGESSLMGHVAKYIRSPLSADDAHQAANTILVHKLHVCGLYHDVSKHHT